MTQSHHPMPDLMPLMKRLCLSGMNDTLAQRNKEAIDGHLSYVDFFGLLLQDEILRREHSRFKQLIRRSGFRGEKTLENFDFSFNPNINQALIKDLASCRFIAEKAPVLIVGPCGTGKTHLAQALGQCAIGKNQGVCLTTQTLIKQDLLAATAQGQYNKIFKRLTTLPLLIIDDFGLKPLRSPEDEYLHDIIAKRYEQHSTIMTSNLDVSEWPDAFPNKLLGAATIDRLRHNAYVITLDGKSYRSVRSSQPESSKIERKESLKME